MTTVLISLGSNQGASVQTMSWAIRRLAKRAGGQFVASSLYRTAPVDCPPGSPDFLNAAVVFSARDEETPETLLAWLKSLEQEAGRVLGQPRNAPRILDLDLVLFGLERRCTGEFTLPHPRAHLRRFVLAPAAEIAPQLNWPGGETVNKLLQQLAPSPELVTRLEDSSSS